MLNLSSEFIAKLQNDERDYLVKVDITLADSTVLHLTNEHIWDNSFKLDDAVGSDNSFTALGSAVINSFKCTINNIYDEFSLYDFYDAEVVVYVGLQLSNSTEYIKKGTFVVDDTTYNGSLINLSCVDYMSKFDRKYSETDLEYPATLDTIIRDACTVCGMSLSTASLNFPNKNYVIQDRPTDEAITFREVISWCATIACCFARCDVNGNLEIKWFDTGAFESETVNLDGGIFDNVNQSVYTTGDTANGGTFNPWNTGDQYDSGGFSYVEDLHIITSLYTQNIGVDDIVITQIVAEVKSDDESNRAILTYSSGTDGYTILIKSNELINESNAQAIVDYIGQRLIGIKFRRVNVTHSSDPSIEAGDVAYIFDRKGNRYPVLITRTAFSVGTAQATVCGADNPLRNSATRFSETTKSYVELRKKLKEQQNAFEEAEAELARRIEEAQGLYETDVEQQGGGVIHYLHNKPELGDSDIRIVVSSVGVTVTPDGGETWYGLTVDGQLIASILTAIGINADWINAGQLVIKDANNNETFFADTETGVVRINATSFTLKPAGSQTGQTIQQIADASASGAVTTANAYTDSEVADARSDASTALADFAELVDTQISEIQAQIDGQIVTYYYDYAPTTSNIPASEWTTEALKSEHQGDVFVDTSSGRSYRWLKTNNVWGWQIIADTDVAAALQAARDAQATADNKRRVFVSQPTPPYDIGDLWVQGSTGDILRCQTDKGTGTSYSSTDWIKASKYTDDSALTTFINGDYATDIASIEQQIDGKAETWYQATDPSASWTTSALRTEHTGDLWYNSTSSVQKYYRWSGSAWQELTATPPDDVFNAIDGKAQIFVNQPTTPYNVGDLWFNSATSDIMTCITARATGNYNASDWQKRNKYTDDEAVVNMVIGGRNFLLKTATSESVTIGSSSSSGYTNYYYVSDYGTSVMTGNSEADEFTLSFDFQLTGASAGSGYSSARILPYLNGTNGHLSALDVTASQTGHYSQTVKLTSAQATYSSSYRLRVRLYQTVAGAILVVKNAKLERSNKESEWTPAIEDIETEVLDITSSLQTQIDSKVETWTQASNPALAWTTVTLKEKHDGDLWYYTGDNDLVITTQSPNITVTNNCTYVYSATNDAWSLKAAATNLFDKIDSKRAIFYGTPSGSYSGVEIDDLLVDPDGSTYRWDGTDWVIASESVDGHSLETPFTWTNNGQTASFIAILYKNDVDVTAEFPDAWFEWYLRTEAGESRIAIGKSCSVAKSSLGYGGTITCIFTTYANRNATLLTRSGNALQTRSGLNLTTYTQIEGEQPITELPIKIASSVVADDYFMGIDAADGYRISFTELTNAILGKLPQNVNGLTNKTASGVYASDYLYGVNGNNGYKVTAEELGKAILNIMSVSQVQQFISLLSFVVRNTDATIGYTPPSTIYGNGYQIKDGADYIMAQFRSIYRTDGRTGTYIQTRRNVGGTDYTNGINLDLDGSGNASVSVSSPSAWRSALGVENTVTEVNPSAVSVATATNTTLCNSGSLSAGTYIITFTAEFAGNTNGTTRMIFLSTSSTGDTVSRNSRTSVAPAGGNPTRPACTFLTTINSATTFYLRAYQNTGSALSVTGGMRILKIH